MKVTLTLDLDYDIMLVLGARAAKANAEGWYDGAVNHPHVEPDGEEKKTLYQYAFADGMLELINLLGKGENDNEKS